MAYDRRKSFRSPLPLEEQAATLTFGREDYAVRVLNVSTGGFEIVFPRKPPFRVGDVVHLFVTGKTSEVKVTRILKSGAGAKVGLKLVRDTVKNVVRNGSAFERFFGPILRARTSRKVVLVLGGMAAVVCVAVVVGKGWYDNRDPYGALAGIHRWRGGLPEVKLTRELKQSLRDRSGIEVLNMPEVVELLELTKSQQAKLRELAATQSASTTEGQPITADIERLAVLQRDALNELTELQKTRLEMVMRQAVSPTYFLRDLARKHWPKSDARELFGYLGAAALTLPKVADELQLTSEQQAKIEEIVEGALDTSEELYQQGRFLTGTPDLAGTADALLQQAREECLALLTDEQRARLSAKQPAGR